MIEDVAKGVKQVCEFLYYFDLGIPGIEYRKSGSIVPIVVTLDDWIFFGNDMRSEVMESSRAMLEADNLGGAVSRIDSVILCTADDLELLFTKFDDVGVATVFKVDRSNNDGSPLSAVIQNTKCGRLEVPRSPLRDKLLKLIDLN